MRAGDDVSIKSQTLLTKGDFIMKTRIENKLLAEANSAPNEGVLMQLGRDAE